MFRNFSDSTALATYWEQISVPQLENLLSKAHPAFEYYSALKNLILKELDTTGSCILVEALLESHSRSWSQTTIYAVFDAIEYATFQQNFKNIQTHYNWDDQLFMKAHNSRYQLKESDRRTLLICYRGLQSRWSELHKDSKSKESDAAQGPKIRFPNFLSGVKPSDQEDPHQQSQAIMKKAQSEAELILADAKKEASRALEEARLEIARKKSEAENEAMLMLASARQQAEALTGQAYRDALQEARAELKEKADRDLQKMIQTNFNHYLAQQRSQWDLEHQELESAKSEISRQTAILKEEACSFANSAGADMNMALSSAIDMLSQMRVQLLEQMQTWKASLYRAEYSPLVSCFNTLVTLQGRFERDMAAEESMTEETVLTKLQQHTQSLSKFRANMERAMHALGLQTFYPVQGELFDIYYHTTDSEEDDELFNGKVIGRCTSPGIIRTVNSQEEVVLHRAEVVIQPSEIPADPQIPQEVSHE